MPLSKPAPSEAATMQQIERHLAELVVLSKKQLQAMRDLSPPPPPKR